MTALDPTITRKVHNLSSPMGVLLTLHLLVWRVLSVTGLARQGQIMPVLRKTSWTIFSQTFHEAARGQYRIEFRKCSSGTFRFRIFMMVPDLHGLLLLSFLQERFHLHGATLFGILWRALK
jgi:hypothetical protein